MTEQLELNGGDRGVWLDQTDEDNLNLARAVLAKMEGR